MNEILRHLPASALVLDLGSSRGSFGGSATPARAVRVDLHFDSKCGEVQLVRADAARLPFPRAVFDAVISNHSLEHFEDLGRALSEIGRVLKPDGALFIAVPDSGTLTDRIYRTLARGGGHVNSFQSSRELAQLVTRRTGLSHKATRTLCTSLSFLNRRNQTAPSPRTLRWLFGDREAVLAAVNVLFRLSDRFWGTRSTVYGWALYFGSIPGAVDTNPWINVCLRCGNAHPSDWLRERGSVRRRWLFFPAYTCPSCGAGNPFSNDADFAHLR
jgi:SAM-dependent methyltransferase